ncbi:MAG: leucine-rich repeat domain-containing protein [Symbiobacteriaceae bacterium]|nr:leucine-rich repeat domain-containing protein [Symbiobacteriaceae bacterium]
MIFIIDASGPLERVELGDSGIVIPKGVRNIGEGEFNDRVPLWDIAIPDGVTAIGEGAFAQCDLLAKVTIPDTVTSIGDRAFSIATPLRTSQSRTA